MRNDTLLKFLRYALLAGLAFVLVLPFVAFALNAFSKAWFYPQVIPQTWTLEAWQRLFRASSDVPEALFNSATLASAVTLASLLIGTPAARALGLYDFRGKRLVEFCILAPVMVPPLAVGMGLSINFLRAGLGGTWLGVALAHLVPVLPYVVFTLTGVFANYDVAYEQQARTLGAPAWRVWWSVTLPLIFPGMMVAALFAFLVSWSQYVLTFLIGRGQVLTAPVLLFASASGGNNASIAVQALLFVAPGVLILLLTARYVRGSSNAVQGIGGV